MIHPPQVRPEEPIAVTPHDGICGGESQQWLSYPTNPHVRFDERGRETGRCRMAQATVPVLDSTCAPTVLMFGRSCIGLHRTAHEQALSYARLPRRADHARGPGSSVHRRAGPETWRLLP